MQGIRRTDAVKRMEIVKEIRKEFGSKIYYSKLFRRDKDGTEQLTDAADRTAVYIAENASELGISPILYIQGLREIIDYLDNPNLSTLYSERSKLRIIEWLDKRKSKLFNSYKEVKKDNSKDEVVYREAIRKVGEPNAFYLCVKDLSPLFIKDLIKKGKIGEDHIEFMKKVLSSKTLKQIGV